MGSFPQSILDEILSKSDIVSAIGEHVTLKRAGRSYRGLCPFHEEKTPSFYVHPEKQVYHCFGCGKGGNLFTFLMAIEKIPFSEAVTRAAQRAGVTLPAGQTVQADRHRDEIIETNLFAARIYHQTLVSPAGRTGFDYLIGREIPEETMRGMLLGFAPKEPVLSSAASTAGIPHERLKRAGLLTTDGREFFRNRILFPIRDRRGAVLGFGGRALDDTQMPKYLNTPETPVFSKSRVLFGLDAAQAAVRERDYVIIVEGYFDVLRLHLAGFANAVAPLGTALTEGHLRALRHMTSNMLLLFDADDAGVAAAMRSIAAALQAGFDVKVGTLPRGFDPDSFLREYGAEGFRTFLGGSQKVLDYCVSRLAAIHDTSTPRGKARVARELVRIFSVVHDEIERDAYLGEISRRLEVSRDILDRIGRQRPEEPDGAARIPVAAVDKAEDLLMGLILSRPEYWQRALAAQGALSRRVEKVLACAGRCPDGSSVRADLLISSVDDPELADWLSHIAVQTPAALSDEQCERIFIDCLRRLRTKRISEQIEEIRIRVREKKQLGMPCEEELKTMQALLADMKKG